jgi:hypothetical protein
MLPAIMLRGRQRWNLIGETLREIGILQSVFGLMDWVYHESTGSSLVSLWWVGGFIAMGVGFICAGLWMQFAVDGK